MPTDSQQHTSDLRTVTILGRLLATRGVWLFFALLLLDGGVLVHTARNALALVQAADVGLLLRPGRRVDAVDARWPGVERGDEVVAWQGAPVADGPEVMAERLAQKPGPLRLTFARGEVRRELTAEATPLEGLPVAFVFMRWFTALLSMLFGLGLFALLPGKPTSWLFLVFTQALGLLLLTLLAFQRDTHWVMVGSAWWTVVTPAILAHFMTRFPAELPGRQGRRLALVWGPALVAAAPILVLAFVRTAAWARPLGVVQLPGALWPALLVLVFLSRQTRLARAQADAVALARARTLGLGLVVGLLFPLLFDMARRNLGIGLTPWSSYFNGAPTIVFVATTAWVSVKHNAFDIDRFTSAVVGYGAALAVLFSAVGALLLALPLMLGPQLGNSPTAIVIVTAACFALTMPLYEQLKKRVGELFFRREADAATLAGLLHKLSVAVQARPPDEALRLGLETALQVGVERVELWRLKDSGDALVRLRHEGVASTVQESELSRHGALAAALARGPGGIHGLSSVVLPPAAQPELWGLELALAVPVHAHGTLAGFLGLSRKRSGVAFTPGDVTFAEALAAQVGLVLERAAGEQQQFGRYRIERRLGVGGMAEVHLAWRLGPGGFERKVALKRPLPQLADDEAAVGMFLDEARIAAQLSHANIVQVYEVDRVDRMVFMALEYVDGPSLREVLKRARARGTPCPPALAVRLVAEVLSALDHAHRCRDAGGRPLELVHRDVNPNNVLLTLDGRVKLTDFGIARAATRIAQTEAGIVKGTLPYMAPEQASGEALDQRADLFPVAAMLYELLTLRRAFPEGPFGPQPLSLDVAREDLPAALRAVVARGLAMDRAQRWPTADAFREALLVASAPLGRAAEADLAEWIASLPATEGAPAVPLAAQDTRTATVEVKRAP